MKQHKQMLSASIIDEDEDIFPKIIETNEEIADPIILINKKREREDLKEVRSPSLLMGLYPRSCHVC